MQTCRAFVVGIVVCTTLAACSGNPTAALDGGQTLGSGHRESSAVLTSSGGGHTFGGGNRTDSTATTNSGGTGYGSGNRAEESGPGAIGPSDGP